MGTTIGSRTGPWAACLYFWGDAGGARPAASTPLPRVVAVSDSPAAPRATTHGLAIASFGMARATGVTPMPHSSALRCVALMMRVIADAISFFIHDSALILAGEIKLHALWFAKVLLSRAFCN